MNPLTDISVLIPALAGAVGALVLRSLIKLIGRLGASTVPIANYPCAEDSEKPGYFQHGWGNAATDNRRKVWSYARNQMDQKEHTLYGPYVNDFGRPGFFTVRFRVSGHGFKKTEESVVVLDVIQAPFDLQRDHIVIGQRIVRSKQLKPRYKNFDITCYTSGVGVYEYRASVVWESFDEGENKIYFDNIRVYRHFPLWDIL